MLTLSILQQFQLEGIVLGSIFLGIVRLHILVLFFSKK